MLGLEEAVKDYVRFGHLRGSFKRIRQHFVTDHDFFNALLGDLEIRSQIKKWFDGLEQRIKTGMREIYYDGFLTIPRDEARRLGQEIKQYAQGLIDFNQYSSKTPLAMHLSEELSISLDLMIDLLAGKVPKHRTPEAIKLHSYMADRFNKALRSVEKGNGLKGIPPKYASPNRENLYHLIARAMEEITGQATYKCGSYVVNGSGKIRGLRNLTEIRQFAYLVNRIMGEYKFPNKETAYRYLHTIAGIRKFKYRPKSHKKVLEPGGREPFSLHRKLHAVGLILLYARENGLKGPHLPVNYNEYSELLADLRNRGFAGNDLATVLAPVLGISKEQIIGRYFKGKDFMFLEQYQKLRGYVDLIIKKPAA